MSASLIQSHIIPTLQQTHSHCKMKDAVVPSPKSRQHSRCRCGWVAETDAYSDGVLVSIRIARMDVSPRDRVYTSSRRTLRGIFIITRVRSGRPMVASTRTLSGLGRVRVRVLLSQWTKHERGLASTRSQRTTKHLAGKCPGVPAHGK